MGYEIEEKKDGSCGLEVIVFEYKFVSHFHMEKFIWKFKPLLSADVDDGVGVFD